MDNPSDGISRMKILSKAAFALGGLILVGSGLAFVAPKHLYRGPMSEPAKWEPTTERAAIVSEARKLEGLWYDPVQGYFHDIGGKLGFIVCMDVPRLAYRNAGTSLRRLLEADYAAHPDHYGKRDGRPGDPYFDRRARNLHAYCKFNGCLDMAGPPEPGDVVFMSRGPNGWISHIALVSETAPDGSYRVVEASRDEWYVTREEDSRKMFERGWTFRGFGRPLRRPDASE
ncbi:MAG: DUF1287 domain-containing protein [Elusimicrobia bacterium]|nr:DUF1287 domain-containing protein [Elusimicrobiota bacterium]